jgi:dienelactone hydrolase
MIRADKLAVVGVSKGGELALLLGATFPDVKAVVGYAASGVVYQGVDLRHKISSWYSEGQSLPFVPYYYTTGMAIRSVWNAIIHRPTPLLPAHSGYLSDQRIVEQATTAVEKIRGPVLLFSGQDDQVWPSVTLAEMVMKRLKEHHHPYEDRQVSYEHAGHLSLPIPNLPTRFPAVLAGLLGGTPEGNAHAVTDAWSRMLTFLQEQFA